MSQLPAGRAVGHLCGVRDLADREAGRADLRVMARPNPTQAEIDRVARQLLATVPTPLIGGQSCDVTSGRVFVKPETDFGGRPDLLDLGPLFEAAIRQRAVRRRREAGLRTYPPGCTCPKLPADGTPQTYDLICPILGHRRLALAARHRKC